MTFKNKGSKPLKLAKNTFKTGENSQSRIIYGNQLFQTLFSMCNDQNSPISHFREVWTLF